MSPDVNFPSDFPKTTTELREIIKLESQKPMQAEEVERIIDIIVEKRISEFKDMLHEREIIKNKEDAEERQRVLLKIQELESSDNASSKAWSYVVPGLIAAAIAYFTHYLSDGGKD